MKTSAIRQMPELGDGKVVSDVTPCLIGIWYLASLFSGLPFVIKKCFNISATLTFTQHPEIAIAGLLTGTVICVTGALMPIGRIKNMEPLLAIKEE